MMCSSIAINAEIAFYVILFIFTDYINDPLIHFISITFDNPDIPEILAFFIFYS